MYQELKQILLEKTVKHTKSTSGFTIPVHQLSPKTKSVKIVTNLNPLAESAN